MNAVDAVRLWLSPEGYHLLQSRLQKVAWDSFDVMACGAAAGIMAETLQ